MEHFFNTAAPTKPDLHYHLDPLARVAWPETQHQIAHKQHKHSFNNETAVNLTAIAHKKRDGVMPSLYCAD